MMWLKKFMLCFKNKKWMRGIWGGLSLAYPFLIYYFSDDFSMSCPIAPLLYPVMMSFGVAAFFGGSLLFPPPLIERIARLSEPNLGPKGVAYTRKVTMAWFIFSLLNAMISLTTALYGNLELWTLYNGFISYLLMGSLFLSEYGFRQYYKRRISE